MIDAVVTLGVTGFLLGLGWFCYSYGQQRTPIRSGQPWRSYRRVRIGRHVEVVQVVEVSAMPEEPRLVRVDQPGGDVLRGPPRYEIPR